LHQRVFQRPEKIAGENCMTALLARRPFTTTEYHQMIEAGILTEKERVELLDGEIVTTFPISPDTRRVLKD
jgi:hypothetical protein